MRTRTARRAAAGIAVGLTIVGTAAAPAHADTVAVSILGGPRRFAPEVVVVDPGDEVVWTNDDAVSHTVTSDDPDAVFDSGVLGEGDTHQRTFASTGATYVVDYYCAIHPGMQGQVVVGEDPPVLAVGDRSSVEGSGQLSFTITLSYPAPGPVTVDAATSDGTASAGTDYTGTATEVTFETGQSSATIMVPLLDDEIEEAAETFSLMLSGASGATIGDGEAVGTIVDDDGADPLVPPTAAAGGPYTATEGVEVALSASDSTDDGTIAAVTWDLDGDGTFETPGSDVTTTYDTEGTVEVTVRVTDDDGLTDEDTTTVDVADTGVVTRSAGLDRVGTSVALSQDHWTSAEDVVLATASAFPDALAAGVLAASLDAPLLLTVPDALSPAVRDELARLRAVRVVLLGGPGAISSGVADELEGLGYGVDRIGGVNRFETAALVAARAGPSATGEVVVALGQHAAPGRDAWPDALSAGALAASVDRVPTLLTRSDRLPDETRGALAALGATDVVLLGGEGAIAPAVADELRGRGLGVRRLAGADRFATSALAAADAVDRAGAGDVPVVFATGRNFPDGLAAGALAAHLAGVLLLVPPDALPDDGPSSAFLTAHARRIDRGVVSGGEGAVSEAVRAGLAADMTAPR